MTKSTTVSVRISYDVYDQIMDIADDNNVKLSEVIRDAINGYIESHNNNAYHKNQQKGIISRITGR